MKKAGGFPDLSYFEDSQFYDELQILKDQAAYQLVNLLVYLASGFKELIIVVSMFFLLASIAFWIPLLILLTSIPQAFVSFQLQRNAWETMVWKSPRARKMQYFSSILLTDSYAKEAKLS